MRVTIEIRRRQTSSLKAGVFLYSVLFACFYFTTWPVESTMDRQITAAAAAAAAE